MGIAEADQESDTEDTQSEDRLEETNSVDTSLIETPRLVRPDFIYPRVEIGNVKVTIAAPGSRFMKQQCPITPLVMHQPLIRSNILEGTTHNVRLHTEMTLQGRKTRRLASLKPVGRTPDSQKGFEIIKS